MSYLWLYAGVFVLTLVGYVVHRRRRQASHAAELRESVEAGLVESVFDEAHQAVGEHAGLHVAAHAGFAGVEQRPQFEWGLEGAECVLDAPQAAVRQRHLLRWQAGGGA